MYKETYPGDAAWPLTRRRGGGHGRSCVPPTSGPACSCPGSSSGELRAHLAGSRRFIKNPVRLSPLDLEVQTLNHDFRLLEIRGLQSSCHLTEKNQILNPEIIISIF